MKSPKTAERRRLEKELMKLAGRASGRGTLNDLHRARLNRLIREGADAQLQEAIGVMRRAIVRGESIHVKG
jgi:hypothetical protein